MSERLAATRGREVRATSSATSTGGKGSWRPSMTRDNPVENTRTCGNSSAKLPTMVATSSGSRRQMGANWHITPPGASRLRQRSKYSRL